MRKNIRVTPVHKKKYDYLESEFNVVIMQKIEPNSSGYLIKHINVLRKDIFTLEHAACSEISIFKMLITWIFYNAVVCSGNIKRDFQLNMQQVHKFLICICSTLVCSISSFPTRWLAYSFVNRDFRLNMQQVIDVSSSHMFGVRFLFISNSANHKQIT